LEKFVNLEVDTPDGKATLCSFYVTELGYIMVKIFYPKKNAWVNHKIGDIKNLLEGENIKLISEWTKSIKIENKL
jgi:hypothetical protein